MKKKTTFEQVCKNAKNLSNRDGRLRFVFATSLGYQVSTKRLPFQFNWWTNGIDCGIWEAFASEGRTQASVAKEMADELFASLA